MPLTADPNQRFTDADLFNIQFPMFDGEEMITVTVTSEAIQDMAAPDGRQEENTTKLFLEYRSSFETIASAKYDDAGDDKPQTIRIVNGDV
jgi:hypothetical protein